MKTTMNDYGRQMILLCERMKKDMELSTVQATIVEGKAIIYCTCEVSLDKMPEKKEEPETKPEEVFIPEKFHEETQKEWKKQDEEKPKVQHVIGQAISSDEEVIAFLKEHPGQTTSFYAKELHADRHRIVRIMKANGIEPNKKRGWSYKGTPPNRGKKFKEVKETERIPIRLDDIPAPKIDDRVKTCSECSCWTGDVCIYGFKSGVPIPTCKPYRQRRDGTD